VNDSIYRAPKGTRDILWPESERWRTLIEIFSDVVGSAGYTQLVLPIFEHAEVFHRLGSSTDVVSKEMYEFIDKGGRHIALRPEQTASVVRSYSQHRPVLPWKVWYTGPNFRYERAQKGRFRQFDQVGVEALGSDDPHLDAEIISLAWQFYERLGLRDVTLLVNSLGNADDRGRYIESLTAHFSASIDDLSAESLKTLKTNPLRLLDSRRPEDIEVVASAPQMSDYLSSDASEHFDGVCRVLDSLGITYEVSPRLVRGLDYYVRTTFEFVAGQLDAAQDAIGGGGRYDGLAETLGAPPTAGVGLALGVDRTLLACDAEGVFLPPTSAIDIFVVDTSGGDEAVLITNEVRQAGWRVDRAWDDRSMKSQMKAADRSGAAYAIIVGEEERTNGSVTIRDLRGDAGQETVSRTELLGILRKRLL